MPVLINFKICDNAISCNGIKVCPTGAFKWNEKKRTLEIDENLCINCGLCAKSEESCPVGAIRFAKTAVELKKIKKEIEDDPRTYTDLVVDRYGCQPIGMPFLCSEENLQAALTTHKLCLVEVLKEELEECLIKSIPVKEIMNSIKEESNYRKIEIKTEMLINQYKIKNLPAMLIFRDSNLLGKIEGYYSIDEKEEFLSKIKDIVNK